MMSIYMTNKEEKQSGFTLIETAIVLVIVASLIAVAVLATPQLFSNVTRYKTVQNMEKIADALAQYAIINNRIPCPANPAIAHSNNNFGREDAARCGSDGIVPFKEIGLLSDDIKDGWKRYITYAVSRTSARAGINNATLINNWCMTYPLWFSAASNSCSASDHRNLAKAAFCCGTWGGNFSPNIGDLRLRSSFGELSGVSRQAAYSGGIAREYRNVLDCPAGNEKNTGLTTFGNGLVADDGSPNGIMTNIPVFPAFILVSHGPDGRGAYLVNETANRTASAKVKEQENYDGDRVYNVTDNSNYQSGAVANHHIRENIDDIVFWQTPYQLMGRLGVTGGCLKP